MFKIKKNMFKRESYDTLKKRILLSHFILNREDGDGKSYFWIHNYLRMDKVDL